MEWTSINKGLPKHSNDVLVCNNLTEQTGIGDYGTARGWSIQGMNYFQPTHWMEFPEIPAEPKWYEKSELPLYIKLTPITQDAKTKYFFVDGKEVFYNFYEGTLISIGYKTGGGTLIHYFHPSTKEEYEQSLIQTNHHEH